MTPAVSDAAIAQLLATPSLEAQTRYLAEADLLNDAALSHLLAEAEARARRDPGQARKLAALCAHLAAEGGDPALVAPAHYLQAQACAVQGDLEGALTLIRSAYRRYRAQGDALHACRTHLGRMHVLTELGRHQEVLALGQQVLDWLDEHAGRYPGAEMKLMRVLAHNNRGVCWRRMGRYREALHAYEQAEIHCLAAGCRERLGDIRNNRGLILLHLGRIQEALQAFTAAAETRAAADLTLLHAESLINVGEANLLLGHYARSLEALSQAEELLEELDAPTSRQYVSLHQADVYLALNLFPEALAAYAEAEAAFAAAGMIHYQARTLWGKGAALLAQSRWDEAGTALAAAAEAFREADNTPLQAGVLLEEAALRAAQGDMDIARQTARESLHLAAGGDWPVQRVYAHLRLADLAPDLATRGEHLAAARAIVGDLPLPPLHYRLAQRLGQLRWEEGDEEAARRWLETAVSQIEQLRGRVAQEAMRVSFLQDKIDAYEGLATLHLAGGNIAEAFAVAEQARSRSLIDLITGVAEPALPTDATARLETLQAELNGLYNQFLGMAPAPATTDPQRRMRAVEEEMRRVQMEAASSSPSPDPFTAVPPLSAIQQHLAPPHTMLVYQVKGEEILAFVIDAAAIRVVRSVARVGQIRPLLQRLAVQWERFRVGSAFVARHAAQLRRSAERVLGQLHAALVQPLAAHLPASPPGQPAPLTIVPHNLLHQVPFHALHDGADYLLDQFVISYAPSATVFHLCQERPAPPIQTAAVLAVPDAGIPAVAAEAEAIAAHLAPAHVYQGAEATREAMATAATADLLHLACHGIFRTDNPMFSALKLGDGWLTAVDVLKLNVSSTLVTLSACESGRGGVLAGDEVIGLTRAFLGAGAATLLVSLWLAPDEPTAALMAEWYRRLRRGRYRHPAAALRAAQRALRDRYPHPYYWAPFMVVGRGSFAIQ